jgi:hypothetical protein
LKPADLDPNDSTVRAAVFGQQVQDWLKEPVGDFCLRQAERELHAAVEMLKTIDPSNRLEITRLQERIRLYEHFEAWLGNAVQEGLTAVAIIEGEDDATGE